MWAIGETVVCIDDCDDVDTFGACIVDPPQRDEVYTIRGICMHGDNVCIVLKELVNFPCMCRTGEEMGFFDWRFELRPSKSMELLRDIARKATPPKKKRRKRVKEPQS